MKTSQAIAKLQAAFPQLELADKEEFDGGMGIWVKNTESASIDINGTQINVLDMYTHDPQEHFWIMGVAKPLHEWLEAEGWHAEPYDAGTLMIYPD